ncbi:MAG TPA: glycosyltransferase [Acidimicrobiales bacterium]|jgi:glycosyltransferase involved in cell wall biosynthesis
MTSDSHIEEPALRGRRAQAYRRGSPNGSKAVAVDPGLRNGADAGATKSNGAVASNGASRPKILHVLEAVGGGTLHHIVDVIQTVPHAEHHVVIPPEPPSAGRNGTSAIAMAAQRIVDSGAAIHRVSMVRNPLHPKIATGVVALRRLIAKLQPAVVHGHSSVGGAFARAAAWGQRVPVVYTPNGVATNRAILMVEKVLARRTDHLIAVSESEGALVLDLGLTSEDRLIVIHNGIDLEPNGGRTFDLRADLGLPADVALVGTVARLARQKAPEEFVRICAEVRRSREDVHFVLVGMGHLQPEVDAAVRSARIEDRFHQIPFLPKASVAIEQFDVFILASLFEGAAYTPLEAMKAGVPVILSDVAGNTDTVEHEVSGLLFPFGDTLAMADGVLKLLADDGLRDSLVAAASARVRDRFDRKEMGVRLAALYQELALQTA